MSELRWEDIPDRAWPAAVQPTGEQLADWLTGMTREQRVWVLERHQSVWAQESDCFVRNHAGRIEDLERHVRLLTDQLSWRSMTSVSAPPAADIDRPAVPDVEGEATTAPRANQGGAS